MIRVEDLLKRHDLRVILGGISFEVKKGETAAVVGPSGGGKTTLLRCLHGLESFDSGKVTLADATLRAGSLALQKPALAKLRSKAGFVFQQWHLFAHMSVLGNVIEAPIHVLRLPRREAVQRAEALLERVGLSHRKEALPRSLSGGEQQRVAIARALAMQPEVLLMDEPTSALDPQRIGSLIELLAKLNDDGLTLVVVTHEISFARRLADRALVLIDGELAEEGSPKTVLEDPKDERIRRFLGLSEHRSE